MTATLPEKRAVAKRVASVPKSKAIVAAVPEFAAALTKMAKELAAERLRADQAEDQLLELNSQQETIDALRADLEEINRNLNHYGGHRGWCEDYEYLQRQVNKRLTQYTLLARPGYSDRRDHPTMPNLPGWNPVDW